MTTGRAVVLDAEGRTLSPCPEGKALRLVAARRAELVREDPLTIRLTRAVPLPEPKRRGHQPPAPIDHHGERLLLHICCGPCATYTVAHLRDLGFDVTGYWFDPNIHPFSEHERRRESLVKLATDVDLPVIWEPGYEMPEFLRLVAGTPHRPGRCRICYRMRLARTAHAAAAGGFDAFSTTLLISPYQDLKAMREIGEEEGAAQGVRFYFENLRKGFAEHGRLAREHGLYMQRYCGCVYSEWEGLRGRVDSGQ
jgi:epoxyqueuosine reductase